MRISHIITTSHECGLGLEFAYNQAPKSMRSLIQAMFLLASALGSYVGSAIVAIVNAITEPNWISENLNESHLVLPLPHPHPHPLSHSSPS